MPYIGTSPSNGVRRVHTYTATASQTTFTGASSEGVTLSYADTNYIDVFQNGVLLGSDDYTATSGTSVVLAQGASADDLLVVVVYDIFSVADTVSKTNGGSFDSAVTMSNNLTVSGDVAVDTDTLKVDSTNDQVGINTTAMNSYYAKDLVVSVADQGGITIVSPTTSGTYLMFADGTSGNERFRGYIEYSHTNDYLAFASAGSERMRIDSTGAITKPNQPAFSTTMSAYLNPIPTSGSTTLGFDTEKFDVGSNFNTSTKTFTSPVTGKYILTVSTRVNAVDTAASYYILNIVTSNGTYRTIIDPNFSGDLSYITLTATVVADMDLNDTAYTEILQNGGTAQSNVDAGTDYTYFTGYLLG